jgi:hypothetical protein
LGSYAGTAGQRGRKQDKQENILVEKISSEHILVYILTVIPGYIPCKISFIYIQVVVSFHLFALRDIKGYNGISKNIQGYLVGAKSQMMVRMMRRWILPKPGSSNETDAAGGSPFMCRQAYISMWNIDMHWITFV